MWLDLQKHALNLYSLRPSSIMCGMESTAESRGRRGTKVISDVKESCEKRITADWNQKVAIFKSHWTKCSHLVVLGESQEHLACLCHLNFCPSLKWIKYTFTNSFFAPLPPTKLIVPVDLNNKVFFLHVMSLFYSSSCKSNWPTLQEKCNSTSELPLTTSVWITANTWLGLNALLHQKPSIVKYIFI